jgi:hypothetical protein
MVRQRQDAHLGLGEVYSLTKTTAVVTVDAICGAVRRDQVERKLAIVVV